MYQVELYLRVRRVCMVDGMSIREASRVFGLHRDAARKMLAYSVPLGYRRRQPPRRPKIGPYTGVIDRILEAEWERPHLSTRQGVKLRLRRERHVCTGVSAGDAKSSVHGTPIANWERPSIWPNRMGERCQQCSVPW